MMSFLVHYKEAGCLVKGNPAYKAPLAGLNEVGHLLVRPWSTQTKLGSDQCAQHEYFKATRLAYFCQSLGCFASSRDRKGPEPSVIPRQALI